MGDAVRSLHALRQNEPCPERAGKLELAIRLIEAGQESYKQAIGGELPRVR